MKKTVAYAVMATMALSLFTGCAKTQETLPEEPKTVAQTGGNLLLQVNPEILISYDENGLVSDIVGRNEDGKRIIETYDNFIGKPCKGVVTDLVGLMKDSGYFVEEIDGEYKTITISLEEGSYVPTTTFLGDISKEVQSTVDRMEPQQAKPPVVTNQSRGQGGAVGEKEISFAEALTLALDHAQVAKAQARDIEVTLDHDDGVKHFEVEFETATTEYEYEIAIDGSKVLKVERDRENTSQSPVASGKTNVEQGTTQKNHRNNDDRYDDDRYDDDRYDDQYDDDRYDDQYDDDRYDDQYDDDRYDDDGYDDDND